MRNRRLENERSHFHRDRYFAVGQEQYAVTREGHDVGPCFSHDQAEQAMDT
jgi:hypothetical protein